MQKMMNILMALSLVFLGAACSSGSAEKVVVTPPVVAPETETVVDTDTETDTETETETDTDTVIEDTDDEIVAGESTVEDADGDDIPDDRDNCPNLVTENVADADGDGIGDACDAPVADAPPPPPPGGVDEGAGESAGDDEVRAPEPTEVMAGLLHGDKWLKTKLPISGALSCLPIHFEDENLKAAVIYTLGTNKVTRCNCDIEELHVDVESSLEGLQYCTNLRELNIFQLSAFDGSPVASELDLRPLQHLSKLTWLELYANIHSFAPLSGLSELQGLSFEYDKLANPASLSGLTSLRKLFLGFGGGVTIQNLEPLRDMGLRELYLLGNGSSIINDISVLSSLDDLKLLYGRECGISDLEALRGLTHLEGLYLAENSISDLAPLYDLVMRSSGLNLVEVLGNEGTLFPGNDLRRAQMNAHYLRQINAELAARQLD